MLQTSDKFIKVSIIIPVYNVSPYLKQALDSVVNQTLQEIEIICIDDCSTDGSWEILEEYAQKDNRIILLKQEFNQGPGAARNRGLDIARGEYIMFLDPDDWFELDACETAYNQIKKNDNDMVLFAYKRYYENSDRIETSFKMIAPFEKYINDPQIYLDKIDTNFITCCYTVTFIYSNELLQINDIRYSNGRNYEDHTLLYKSFIHARSISIIQKALYYYRIRVTSSTFIYSNQHEDLLNSKKSILEFLRFDKNDSNIKKAIYAHTIISAIYWFYRYTKNNKLLEKTFYNNIKKIFLLLDKKYVEEEIKQRIDKDVYNSYKMISRYNYFTYKIISNRKKIFNNIFSAKNRNGHKVITILGFKFKFKKGISLLNYRYLSYLIAWIFPLKEDRAAFRGFCTSIDERKYIFEAQKRYPKIAKKLKNKKGKIKVLFLMNDIAKWKTQSLYDLMIKSDNFEPLIAITIADLQWRYSKQEKIEVIENNLKYFQKRGMHCVIAYDIEKDRPIKLKSYNPDIVFYQHPHRVSKIQDPKSISKYALPAYVPYFVNNYKIYPTMYGGKFHNYLFRHYALNKEWELEYKKFTKNNKNIIGLGHTMLDNIYLNKGRTSENNYVIYAPHWSMSHPQNRNLENYSTFLKNRFEILEYAKCHSELNWVFKPHPRLKDALKDIGETNEQINYYWNEWKKIGKVCEDSSYMDLFLDSKALITDCGSFLMEYFCTGKPLIHLISSDTKVQPNTISQKIYDTFYKIHNLDEMYFKFDKILLKNEDDKRNIRLETLEKSGLLNNYAAENIIKDLENAIYK